MKKYASNIELMGHYLAINGVGSPIYGFMNGKAGISLVLFELARKINNQRFEEYAFKLIQESMLSKTKSIDFNNGLTGIGYALIYLMNNDFIESDFDQLFGKKHEYILKEISENRYELGIYDSLYFIEYRKKIGNVVAEIDAEINKSIEMYRNTCSIPFSKMFLEEYYENLSKCDSVENTIIATLNGNDLIENVRKVKIVLLDMLLKEYGSQSRIKELLIIS